MSAACAGFEELDMGRAVVSRGAEHACGVPALSRKFSRRIRLFSLDGSARLGSWSRIAADPNDLEGASLCPTALIPMLTRRTFILAGVAGGAALVAARWLRSGRDTRTATPPIEPLAALDPGAPAIVAAIVPVLLGGALPIDPAPRADAVDETVTRVARAVSGLPPAAQRELGELFALLDFAPARLALTRVTGEWAHAGETDVAAFLERWRASRFTLLRSAYDALHQLVFAAWYGNPRSWPAIGYGGPPALSP